MAIPIRLRLSLRLTLLLSVAAVPAAESRAALVFNLSSTGNANADAGFTRAANYLSSQFTDDVTVNVTTGFSNLGPGILGQASSTTNTYSFTNWKTAMTADVLGASDSTMVSNLPGGNSFSTYINRTADNPNGSGSATPYVDSAGANNTILRLSNANAKALGLIAGGAGGQDAQISFSDQFSWDFDPTDGITAGATDFVGVAVHELMHAMGFTSGIDVLDFNSPPFGGTFAADAFTFVTGLDFTRFSAAALAAGADIDWTADSRAKFFSIDGGATNLTPGAAGGFSTGVNFGDGRQNSHWKDNQGWGIMDPTSVPAGSANVVSALDLQALDVIGWNTVQPAAVPEPGSVLLLSLTGVGAAFVGWRRKRRTGQNAERPVAA